MQIRGAYTEAVHDARSEVLDEDVGARRHLAQELAALLRLEIERHRFLVGIEHRERERRPAHVAATAQMLADEGLDLDHGRARERHQKRRVGPVVDVRKIDDRDSRERVIAIRLAVDCRLCCGHAASGIRESLTVCNEAFVAISAAAASPARARAARRSGAADRTCGRRCSPRPRPVAARTPRRSRSLRAVRRRSG